MILRQAGRPRRPAGGAGLPMSPSCHACRVINGWAASMAPKADVNTARSILRWTRAPATSWPWSSCRAERRQSRPAGPPGPDPEDQEIATVTGDGAFDTRRCHTAILARSGAAIIPTRQNGRFWREDCPAARVRNDILRATRLLGRAIWKNGSGHHVRRRIEAKIRGLRSFGERIASRDPDRLTARPPKSTSASSS